LYAAFRCTARHHARATLETTTQVESHEDLRSIASSRDLAGCRVEAVSEIELEHVAARRFLDAKGPRRACRGVAAKPRRRLTDDIYRRTDTQSRAQADKPRIHRAAVVLLIVLSRDVVLVAFVFGAK